MPRTKQSVAARLVGEAVHTLDSNSSINRVVMTEKHHTVIAYHGNDAIIVVLKTKSDKQAKLFV